MSPSTTLDYVTDVRAQLSRYIAHEKTSQSQVAKGLDVSKTTVSLFLKGTYTGNNEELSQKIEQYIRMGTARKAVIKVPEVNPSVTNTRNILRMTKIAHMNKDILLIHGPAGCGKTTALKHYAKSNNGVIIVEADVTIKTPRGILMLILSTMGEDTKGTTSVMMQRLISKLDGSDKLLIIDEAQHLGVEAFDAIRAINDKAHVGIVYAGNPEILRRMYGKQEEELDQLYSRIVYKCELKNSHTQEDISSIYKAFRFNDECLQYLHKISRRKGGLRTMVNQCRIAQNLASGLGEEFSPQHLDRATTKYGVGGGM